MPTRLPYGLSFIKPGDKAKAYTFNYTATPSVKLGTVFFNSDSAITITNMTGGERGKIVIIDCNSSSIITIQNSAGGINCLNALVTNSAGFLKYSSTGNLLLQKNEAIMFVHNGTDWDTVGSLVRVA
jgi:hypothetical protein